MRDDKQNERDSPPQRSDEMCLSAQNVAPFHHRETLSHMWSFHSHVHPHTIFSPIPSQSSRNVTHTHTHTRRHTQTHRCTYTLTIRVWLKMKNWIHHLFITRHCLITLNRKTEKIEDYYIFKWVALPYCDKRFFSYYFRQETSTDGHRQLICSFLGIK